MFQGTRCNSRFVYFQIVEMPRSKEGVKRNPVDPESLKNAVEAVTAPLDKKISIREACRVYGVKLATLSRHLAKHRLCERESFEYVSRLDNRKIFSDIEENSLKEYIVKIAKMNYGLSKKGVRELAFKFAKANNKQYPAGWEANKIAGEEWMRAFMNRHRDLSVRKPRSTSLSRATSFNKTNVGCFFDNIESVHRRFGPIPPERIWNCDETGMSTVQTPGKVVAPKGMKQIGSATSAERGNLVTLIAAICASGNFIPPMLIFPRVNFKDRMLYGAPPGSIGAATPSGWSNEDTFFQFMQHFIKFVKPSKEERVILFIDNHETHLTIESLDLASNAGIIMVTFPPHTSHKLQPLDLTVYGSLKNFYNQAVDSWLVNHPGTTFDIYGVGEVVGKAYPRALTPLSIMNGFRASGIFPFDRDIFTEDDFLPSYVSDRPAPRPDFGGNITHKDNDSTGTQDTTQPIATDFSVPGPSVPLNNASSTANAVDELTPHSHHTGPTAVSPADVQPFPKAGPRKNPSWGRKPGKTMIATDTPEKKEIKATKTKKLMVKRKLNLDSKLKSVAKKQTRKRNIEETNRKQKVIKMRKPIRKHSTSSTSEDDQMIPYVDTDDEDSNDEECLFCKEPFKNDYQGEQWIRCMRCNRWAHELCADSRKGCKTYICDFCKTH